MNTAPLCSGGMWTSRSRACATGLRTNATSRSPGMRKSATYWPRPRRNRSSSLRATDAPTPMADMRELELPARKGRNDILIAGNSVWILHFLRLSDLKGFSHGHGSLFAGDGGNGHDTE